MNSTVHNTQFVTAHFHLIFGGAVVIMYFAIAYELWPRLTGRPLPRRARAPAAVDLVRRHAGRHAAVARGRHHGPAAAHVLLRLFAIRRWRRRRSGSACRRSAASCWCARRCCWSACCWRRTRGPVASVEPPLMFSLALASAAQAARVAQRLRRLDAAGRGADGHQLWLPAGAVAVPARARGVAGVSGAGRDDAMTAAATRATRRFAVWIGSDGRCCSSRRSWWASSGCPPPRPGAPARPVERDLPRRRLAGTRGSRAPVPAGEPASTVAWTAATARTAGRTATRCAAPTLAAHRATTAMARTASAATTRSSRTSPARARRRSTSSSRTSRAAGATPTVMGVYRRAACREQHMLDLATHYAALPGATGRARIAAAGGPGGPHDWSRSATRCAASRLRRLPRADWA